MNIPPGTSAIWKYLRACFPMANEDLHAYMEQCIQHGMKYGKLRQLAEQVEGLNFNLLNRLLHFGPDFDDLFFQLRTSYAESAPSRHQYWEYVQGNGVEIGSGGWPMAPHAIQVELSKDTYARYNSGNSPEFPIQYHTDNPNLPFKDASMDWVGSSHLLEDYADWWPPLREWTRILKRGGYLVILIPEKELWAEAMSRGQPPNCAHRHEGQVGELSKYSDWLGLRVVRDSLTNCYPGDYSILFVGQKI